MSDVNIWFECLCLVECWVQLIGVEIWEVLYLVGFIGGQVVCILGLGVKGDCMVWCWVGEDLLIFYVVWVIFCDLVGIGVIWKGQG